MSNLHVEAKVTLVLLQVFSYLIYLLGFERRSKHPLCLASDFHILDSRFGVCTRIQTSTLSCIKLKSFIFHNSFDQLTLVFFGDLGFFYTLTKNKAKGEAVNLTAPLPIISPCKRVFKGVSKNGSIWFDPTLISWFGLEACHVQFLRQRHPLLGRVPLPSYSREGFLSISRGYFSLQ